MKTVLIIFFSFFLKVGITQTDFFKKNGFTLLFCGTTASDTNTYEFLKSSYEKTIEFIGKDSLLIFLEIPEDDIFIQRNESKNSIFDLYELVRYGESGNKLEEQYSDFYSNLIRQSKQNKNIILRGYRNPLQVHQIHIIRKYYPELISKSDSVEIADSLESKNWISKGLFDKLTENLNNLKIDQWDKAYIGTWLNDLYPACTTETYPHHETYWDSLLKPLKYRIVLSPYEQIQEDYTPMYMKKYVSKPIKILLYKQEVVLTKSKKYKTMTNKKYVSRSKFVFVSKSEKKYLYSNSKNNFKWQIIEQGSYYGTW